MPAVGPPPPAKKAPPAPDKTFGQYQPKLGFLDKILASRRRALVEEASRRFEQDLRAWEQECGRLAAEYEAELAAYRSRDAEIRRAPL